MESKFDWLTLTLKPESRDVTFEDCIKVLGDQMLLADLFAKMVPVGRFAFYDWAISYENITLCCPTAERFAEQGVCLRISSQGLDYLTRYLKTYNITLKQWLGEWRALCFQGYISKETRLDYAMDDIHFNGEKPVLTMKKIMDCRRNGEMCKKARVVDILDGSTSVKERFKTVDKEPVVGRTVYVGSRYSDVCCRFYDKLAEQLQTKQDVPDNCTSWVRCEFELKGAAAMSALNAFLDYDEVGFGKYMRGVVNNYVSFVVLNNKNISRCSIKRWWLKFLGGCTEKFRLPHKEPARSAWARAQRGLCKYVPTVYTMFQTLGLDGVYLWFEAKVQEMIARKGSADKIYKPELAHNLMEDINDYEEMNGLKYYKYNSFDGEEGWSIEDNINWQHWEYYGYRWKVLHNYDYNADLHNAFMDGFEVLT